MYRDLPETLSSLTLRLLDDINGRDARLARIETFEMADGSGRWAATAYMQGQDDSEYLVRHVAPAPADAPAWSQQRHGNYEVDVLRYDEDGRLAVEVAS